MRIKLSLLVIVTFLIFSGPNQAPMAQPVNKLKLTTQPTIVGNKIAENLLRRKFGWRYQKVCSYYGALIYADAVNNTEITKQIEAGYHPYLVGKKKPRKGHVDYNVFGIWPLELYRQTGKQAYFEMGMMLADHEYKNPREDGLTKFSRFWVDDMYMVGALQVQAYKAMNAPKYLDRAVNQIIAYCDSLQRPNGLFYHRHDAPYYWGRGNGWGAAAMAEVLQVIPKDHHSYAKLTDAYKKMMKGILTCQGDDGMWHQLMNDQTTFAETSCTGMFLYALITGVHLGILPNEEYIPAIEKGWNALCTYVNDKGETLNTVMWTNARKNRRYYTLRPRIKGDYHGQAAVLWASTALIKWMNDK